MKISFIVLHYGRYSDTRRCVDSLLKLACPADCSINVIVVNNSVHNSTGQQLQDEYKKRDAVIVLSPGENLGFSLGNNYGCEYERANIGAEIVVALNNDAEILQEDFLDVLLDEYLDQGFDVLSPDIYQPQIDYHQSPVCRNDEIEETLLSIVDIGKSLQKLTIADRVKWRVKNVANRLFSRSDWFINELIKRRKRRVVSREWENPQLDIVPQGAAVIFSDKYLSKSEYLFVPNDFLYAEEWYLKAHCDDLGCTARYTPRLQVLHHHKEVSHSCVAEDSLERRVQLGDMTVSAHTKALDYYRERLGRGDQNMANDK